MPMRADFSIAAACGFTPLIHPDRAPKSRYPPITQFAARLELSPEFIVNPVDPV